MLLLFSSGFWDWPSWLCLLPPPERFSLFFVMVLPSAATTVRVRSEDEDGEVPSRFMDGRMSFFCFEAGRISSRSTGTPRETRKRRRMRDLIQFGGWRGGGATS